MVQEAVLLESLAEAAVIVAVPGAIAVTLPEPSTDTTALSLLLQLMPLSPSVRFSPSTFAERERLAPTVRSAAPDMLTPVTFGCFGCSGFVSLPLSPLFPSSVLPLLPLSPLFPSSVLPLLPLSPLFPSPVLPLFPLSLLFPFSVLPLLPLSLLPPLSPLPLLFPSSVLPDALSSGCCSDIRKNRPLALADSDGSGIFFLSTSSYSPPSDVLPSPSIAVLVDSTHSTVSLSAGAVSASCTAVSSFATLTCASVLISSATSIFVYSILSFTFTVIGLVE